MSAPISVVLDSQVKHLHDYLADLEAERDLYERSGALVAFLVDYRARIVAAGESNPPLPELIETLAVDMYEYGIIGEEDVVLTLAWLQDLADAGYSAAAYNVFNIDSQHNLELVEQPPAQQLPQAEDAGNPHHLLVIAVVSIRPDRRLAIRNTWLEWGDERVVVRFFTEQADLKSRDAGAVSAALAAESDTFGDLVIMDVARGMNFAVKLLWAMRWLKERYSFDYFLRLDDDFFLCLNRLLGELEANKERLMLEAPLLYGGFRYCHINDTHVDEAYMLLSAGLVDRVLSIEGLWCGAHAGVSAGWWFRERNQANIYSDVRWFFDPRLDYRGNWWKRPGHGGVSKSESRHMCEYYIGVHHTYVQDMGSLWLAAKDHPGPQPGQIKRARSSFDYAADTCEHVRGGVSDKKFARDNAQPCNSFRPQSPGHLYCGAEGC